MLLTDQEKAALSEALVALEAASSRAVTNASVSAQDFSKLTAAVVAVADVYALNALAGMADAAR